MSWYVSQYVSICDFYLWTKPIQHLLLKELCLLPILNTRWKTLNINFIVELSESVRFDTVITIIYSMSKKIYFILTHITVIAESTAKLTLYYVWKHYSLSTYIMLDRGLQFIVLFTKELYYLFRVKIVSFIA